MDDLIEAMALVVLVAGIGLMLLPGLTDALTPHNPYRQAKPYSPWVRRIGLAFAVLGLGMAALYLGTGAA